MMTAEVPQKPDSMVVRRGDLTIDLGRCRVLLGYEPIVLSYREYALLVSLATRAGHVVTKRRLLEEGLGRHDFGGLRMVDEVIRHVKAKLERAGEIFIEETTDGYRFV
jgi:two-component system, OmpR family, KDP operon response regulator KdpE